MVDEIVKQVSPKWSLHGYNFWIAVKRNKEPIKLFLAVIIGLATLPIVTWKVVLIGVITGLVILASKIVEDFVEFVSTEVKL
jgi:hypothetical protein